MIAPPVISGFSKLHGALRHVFGEHLSSADIAPDVGSWVALHSDNANMLAGSVGHGIRLCPESTRQNLGGTWTTSATMSVSEPPHERPSQTGYYNWVRSLGWELDVSALIRDANGRICEASTVDGAVRRRIRESADNPYVDEIFVFSGDGAMAPDVRYARRAGKRVIVLAWSNTLHPALAAAASGFAFIDDLGSLICRPHSH